MSVEMIEKGKTFDYLTAIEKELVECGYRRFKYDHRKEDFVEMQLSGDPSYYFSSMGSLDFRYRKNGVEFIVGLNQTNAPPMLCGCNRDINFNGEYYNITSCQYTLIDRMLNNVGMAEFIELVEHDKRIDFDMREAHISYYQESKSLYNE